MAAATIRRIIAGPNRGTNAHPSDQEFEGGSVTAKAGAVLVNSSGVLIEDATGDGTSTNKIVGISEEDAHNATTTTKLIRFLTAENVFEGTLATSVGGTPSTTVSTTAIQITLAQSDLFASYNLAHETGGHWFVDQGNGGGSNTRVLVVGFRDPVGTKDPRVYFKILTSKKAEA